MKKKLAIFTAAVAFFTLCNVVFYTRRIRDDEMAIFWRSSLTAPVVDAAAPAACNGSSTLPSVERAGARPSTGRKRSIVAADTVNGAAVQMSTGQKHRQALGHVDTTTTAASKRKNKSPTGGAVTVDVRRVATASAAKGSSDGIDVSDATAESASAAAAATLDSDASFEPATFHRQADRSSGSGSGSSTASAHVTVTSGTMSSTASVAPLPDPRFLWSQAQLSNRTCLYNAGSAYACVQVALVVPNRVLSVAFHLNLLGRNVSEQDEEDYFTTTTSFTPTIEGSTSSNGSYNNANNYSDSSTSNSSISNSTLALSGDSAVPLYTVSPAPWSTNDTKAPSGGAETAKPGASSGVPYPFSYLVNVHDLCRGPPKELLLVILVTTATGHVAQRQAIRDTWGGLAKRLPNVRFAFVMGRPADPREEDAILREALTYADIVQEDFVDTYKNLTLKSIMLLRWTQSHCSHARYVMKADDDMFINVPNLLLYLRSLRYGRGLLAGRLVRGARPLRSRKSKYFVSVAEYKDKRYPDYLSGTAYVMSADVVPKLYSMSQVLPRFFLEDVFITGMCAKRAKIVRRNHNGFVYFKRAVKGCAFQRVISGHDNTPKDLRKIWNDFQRKNMKC